MTLDRSSWRSASDYDYAETLSAGDMAWEWLRRNDDYQRDYLDLQNRPDTPQQLTHAMRQRWGLRFPH